MHPPHDPVRRRDALRGSVLAALLGLSVLGAAALLAPGCYSDAFIGSDCPPGTPSACCPCPVPEACPDGAPPLPAECNDGGTDGGAEDAASDGMTSGFCSGTCTS